MPRRLTKPTNVPEARQPLVDMLWRFFVAAGRPSMRRIAEAIEELDDDQRNGTANHETIRRTLQGQSVGAWLTAEVIFLALCELADVDPTDEEGDDGDRWNPPTAHIEEFRRRWNAAVDLAPMPDLPRTRAERAAQETAERAKKQQMADWARQTAASDSRGIPKTSSNEPPF